MEITFDGKQEVDGTAGLIGRTRVNVDGRDKTLKERLAAAVSDRSLAREMRRLMNEASSHSFIETSDTATEWAGGDTIITASHHETTAIPDGFCNDSSTARGLSTE